MILAGVDAGATGARALAVDAEGRLIGGATSGPANPYNTGPARAAEAIAAAVREATHGAGPDILVAGVAGIDDPQLRLRLAQDLTDRLAARVHLSSDAVIALDGAFGGGPGLVVIAGTGSVAWGRNARGQEARAGGWGHLIDDAGSGFDVARRMLDAVLRAYDGRGPQTQLLPKVLASLGLKTPQQIAGIVRQMKPAQLAALAPLVFDAQAEDDTVAGEIIVSAADQLARAAAAVWAQLGFSRGTSVAGVGGLFRRQAMRDAFARTVNDGLPDAVIIDPRLPPVGGALWRAFVLAHAATASLVAHLAAVCVEAGQVA